MNHNELRQKALNRLSVRKAFESLKPEYSLLKRMLSARKHMGLTQAEVAQRMGTKAPAIVRLERSLETGAHSPSLDTLKKYAEAVNCTLDIKLVASK
jgi:transcriptional regulator with XRE-family HTH domain